MITINVVGKLAINVYMMYDVYDSYSWKCGLFRNKFYCYYHFIGNIWKFNIEKRLISVAIAIITHFKKQKWNKTQNVAAKLFIQDVYWKNLLVNMQLRIVEILVSASEHFYSTSHRAMYVRGMCVIKCHHTI